MQRNENVIQIIRNNYRVVGKLFRYSKEFRKSYILALVINAFTMVRFSFVIGFSIQWVTDTALSGEWNAFRNAVLFAAIAFVLNAALYYLEGHLMLSRVAMMMAKLKEELYQKQAETLEEKWKKEAAGDAVQTPWLKRLLEMKDIDQLGRVEIVEMVDRIVVYEDCKIKISYNFGNEF